MTKRSDDSPHQAGTPGPVETPVSDAPEEQITPVVAARGRRRRVDPAGERLQTSGVPQPKPAVSVDGSSEPATTPLETPITPAFSVPATAQVTEPLEDSFVDEAAARARARERAVVGSPTLARVLQVVLAVLAPVVILIGMLRLVASPLFLWFEYRRPGFPADAYGMELEQRMTLGSYGLDYLFNFAPPAYLGDLVFPNGNAVFAQGEVAHMIDVKQVMGATMLGGVIAAVVCVVAMVLLFRMSKGAIARGLFAGAVWFTVLVVVLAVVALFGWEAFFTGFHQIFFADGTWTFAASDSLIRLYPGQFWIDAAAWVAGLTLVCMVVIMLVTAPTGRRRYRRAQAQRFMESQVTGRASAAQPYVR